VAILIIVVCENQAITNQIITPIVIHGSVKRKLLFTDSMVKFSCWNDRKKKNSQERP
jgi:hypothetical protein